MTKLSNQDVQEINRFRELFPNEITVKIQRSEDGGFSAELLSFPGVVTEGDTFSELIEMINDAIITHFEIPEKYVSYIANYIPPLELAQQFGIFPIIEEERNLKLQLARPRD